MEGQKIMGKSDVLKLKLLSTRHKENYNRALTFAKKRGWDLRKLSKDGVVMIFYGMTDNFQPIYVESLNRNSGITSRANTLYSGGSLGLSVHGESMTAGVWDVGALRVNHEAYENRVIQMDNLGSAAVYYDHPTHVAGTIAASDKFLNGIVRGMAYKSNVHGYDVGGDLGEVANEAAGGLLLSNHSYGASEGSMYYGASNFDEVMYKAPFYLSVWACGNGGGPIDKINPNATVKNGLAVGSVHKVLNYLGPSSVIASTFSSRGPSDDGRVKPDIVAMGDTVFSTIVGVGGTYGPGYGGLSGTSMSAPSVTGTLLLLQQHYANVNSNFMRASTLKGLALHTADEAGLYPGPDITFGWGLINAEKAANAITNNGGVSYISEDSLATGGLYTRELVASGSEPLVATICWTDLPGSPTAIDNDPTPKLVNDLDLRLSANGTTYYPWKLDLSNVTGPAIQGDNNRDNIEKIEIPNPVAGQVYTLRVNHKGTLADNGQRFSVIITGLEECVVNRNIASSVNTISVDHQQASSTILATNTVNTGAEAVYHAGDQVLMTDGFTAVNGSVYRAYIEACSDDYAARKGAVERPVVTYNIPTPDKEITLTDDAVYPNPGNGIFNVKVAGLHEGTVRVINLNGNEFFNKKFKDQQELNIDIKNETPGMYIIRVVSGSKVYTKTIMKF
ncbi:hypothetical protein Dfri01_53010 [Dyadobacter frigoris]|nr:hypothetical protein Dfri01_53010 [Dyadobacter frigoris]